MTEIDATTSAPRTLADIFGQEHAIDWLRRAYLADRLPHALIFAGPTGVGKGTAARALSRLFLCENPNSAESCGACASCQLCDAGNHPDLHVITKELIRYHDKTGKSKAVDLSINVIRPEMIEPAGRKANMGRGKVFLIEQADYMTAQAQNAMLKTLEEPAGRTLIVLLTPQPNFLLPTIRSRCQMVRFSALSPVRVKSELQNRGIDAATAEQAANLSGGSLGAALKWIEDGVIASARELAAMIDGLFVGQIPPDLPGWFKAVADAYAARQLERDELGSKDQANREGLSLYLFLAAEHIRQRLPAGTDPVEIERACAAIDTLVQAEALLDANVSIPLIFQHLASKLERVAG